MGEYTFRDVNFGTIAKGSASTISLEGDLPAEQFPSLEAEIVELYIINNSPNDVDERGTGATIPANQPRRLTPDTRKTQATIEAPNGKVDDGEVTADIKVAWGDDLQQTEGLNA